MNVPVKTQELAVLMKRKRAIDGLTLRQAAAASHVSLGTYYRAETEAKGVPDIATLLGICAWLGVSVDDVLEKDMTPKQRSKSKVSTPDAVEAHLRADKNLSPETAKALASVFKAAYEHFVEKDNS